MTIYVVDSLQLSMVNFLKSLVEYLDLYEYVIFDLFDLHINKKKVNPPTIDILNSCFMFLFFLK